MNVKTPWDKWCNKCGSKLIESKRENNGYHVDTGKPKITVYLQCPLLAGPEDYSGHTRPNQYSYFLHEKEYYKAMLIPAEPSECIATCGGIFGCGASVCKNKSTGEYECINSNCPTKLSLMSTVVLNVVLPVLAAIVLATLLHFWFQK